MNELTEAYIDGLAPNAAAMKNAQGLVKKKSFVQRNKTEDGTLLFGECQGSGSSNYLCSADFVVIDKPILRCSCPSRQLPCKHALGLLYAYVAGQEFQIASTPEDIIAKREKVEKREEQKASRTTSDHTEPKPKKVNKSALKKKITAQLEGLELLHKIVDSLIRNGLGTIDKKTIKELDGHIKQLGNYYLPGAQIALRRLSLLLTGEEEQRERAYTEGMEQLTVIHALIKKGRQSLLARLEAPDLKPDHETTIEEWLGYAWQLSELKEYGLMNENVELVQLTFLSYDDRGRQEWIDTGYWLELASGEIHKTMNYRPYKAAKHIREEDSFFEVAEIKELYRYPGDMNRRVRWEGMRSRSLSAADYTAIKTQAHRSYAEVLKIVKNQLKNPLADKHPVLLLHVAEVKQTEAGALAIGDSTGQFITLADSILPGPGTVELLSFIPAEQLHGGAMLVVFEHGMDSGKLLAQPLSVTSDTKITRLLY